MAYRIVTGELKPGSFDECVKIIEDSLIPALRQREGWESFEVLGNRDSNRFVVIAQWTTKEHALQVAADGFEKEQMAKVAHLLSGAPIIDVVESEASFAK